MDVITNKCCGIDVHQKKITITTLIGDPAEKPKKLTQTFGTTTPDLKICGQWLADQAIEMVLMESTGQYWRPVWQILETFGFKMILCNPRIIKNIPGKKTDQLDSEWIAELARFGLVAASFIPPRPIQELRESTRTHKSLTQAGTQIKNQIHNILQRSNTKLTSFISDIFQGSGLKLLNLLINGEVITTESVSKCMHPRLQASPQELVAALDGSLSANDRVLLDIQLDLLKHNQLAIARLEASIEEQLEPFQELYLRLQEIPGVSQHIATIIIAEVGPDVSPFPDAAHLASWAGVCPGNYESAGISKSSHVRSGNVYLKTALVTAALGAKKQTNSGLKDFFFRLRTKMGAQKALVALAHKLIRIIYAMLSNNCSFRDYNRDQQMQYLLASN